DGALLNGDTDTDPKPLGHGTAVATTLAAVTNNGTGTAAPAFLAKVYPVIISDPDGWGYDSTVIVGILKAQENGIRLINLSFQSFPPHTYADQADHPVLHAYLKQYHDDYNGLFFNGAGNSEFADPNPRTSNLIMISGTDKFDRLAFFTNTGSPLWFAAPAVLVQASDRNGQTQFVNGTSFAGPLACGVAAQILSKFPHLTNDQILDLMARTARREMNGYHPSLYGYGIPDAGRATKGKKLR
ncbi:MAG TPA: S8 family serine peptidase, partial [Candidatus Obscuribacterales bacterium]